MALIRKKECFNERNPLTLAFRVLPRSIDTGLLNKSGTKTKKQKLDSVDVFNKHLNILDAQHIAHRDDPDKKNSVFVYYSSDVHFDADKAAQINEIIFFSYVDQWAARCRVEVFTANNSVPFIPADVNPSNCVDLWMNTACPTWIKIYDYVQIDYGALNNFKVTNPNKSGSKYLGDLITNSKRFSRAYIEKI